MWWNGQARNTSLKPTSKTFWVFNWDLGFREVAGLSIVTAINSPNNHTTFRIPKSRNCLRKILTVILMESLTFASIGGPLKIQE